MTVFDTGRCRGVNVKVIRYMYVNCGTAVRSVIGNTEAFTVNVMFLFAVVMGVVTEEVLNYHIGP